MKVAIVDDLQKDIDELLECIKSCFQKNKIVIDSIDIFKSGEEFLKNFKKNKYDLIFLDICMEKMNGIAVAEKIRKIDLDTKLIFISVSNDFASESYVVNASYYLLKPFQEKDLSQAIMKFQLHKPNKKSIITLPNHKEIPIDTIIYSSFYGHYATIHNTLDTPLKIRCTQKELEGILLSYSNFILCTRGMIANLTHVVQLADTFFVMDNGQHIPISRRNYTKIKQIYYEYLIQKVRDGDY